MQNVTIIAIILFTIIGSGLLLHTASYKLNQWFPTSDGSAYERPARANRPGGVNIELQVFPPSYSPNGTVIPRPAGLPRIVSRGRDPRPIPILRHAPPEYDCEAGLECPPPVYSVEPGEHDACVISRSP